LEFCWSLFKLYCWLLFETSGIQHFAPWLLKIKSYLLRVLMRLMDHLHVEM
jgi:hypothetical protein